MKTPQYCFLLIQETVLSTKVLKVKVNVLQKNVFHRC